MQSSEIVREIPTVTPPDLAFGLAISWRDYQLAKHHYQEISVNRQEFDQSLVGMEEEIAQVLDLQKQATVKYVAAFQNLSPSDRAKIVPERRLECLHILQCWQREQELEYISHQPSKERDHDRSR